MNKKEIVKMAEKYSSRTFSQADYMAGFQAACNIVRQKLEACCNDDFYSEMEGLAEVAYMDLSLGDQCITNGIMIGSSKKKSARSKRKSGNYNVKQSGQYLTGRVLESRACKSAARNEKLRFISTDELRIKQ